MQKKIEKVFFHLKQPIFEDLGPNPGEGSVALLTLYFTRVVQEIFFTEVLHCQMPKGNPSYWDFLGVITLTASKF